MDKMSDAEAQWKLTLQHSPVGMAMISPAGNLLSVNRSFCEMLDYEASTLRGMNVTDITHPEDQEADLDLREATLAGERTSYRLRKRYLCSQGRVVWGDLSVALLRDETGRPLHFISQVLDVTAQHDFEERIADAKATIELQNSMVRAVYDSVDVGLVLIDRAGRYERINKRHRGFLDLAFPHGHDGHAGQLGLVFGPDGTTPLTREEMPSVRALQGEEFEDVRIWIGEGPRRRALSVSARTVHGASGVTEGAALAYKDVTDYVRALGVKDEFVALVSHELRTPLTSVLGHLEMLAARPDLPAEAHAELEVVERNAVRLDNLVSDLLDVGQGHPEHMRLARTECDLSALVREAVDAAQITAERAGVHVKADLPDSLLSVVDPQRMRQVLDNLISNGVKYTDEGGSVCVSLTLTDGRVEISVADTGIGISADDAERLFTRFFRAPAAEARMAPGTGLGLSIVRSIVQAHGGEVTMDSEVGHGSTFRVTLPHDRS